MELGSFLILHARATGRGVTVEDLEFLEARNNKKTLGKLLNEVRKFLNLGTQEIDLLEKANQNRNFLAHHYFSERPSEILNIEGRKKMIKELDELTDSFIVADTLMTAATRALGKLIGISEEMVENELKKFITQ
jgi:hypothetical protein